MGTLAHEIGTVKDGRTGRPIRTGGREPLEARPSSRCPRDQRGDSKTGYRPPVTPERTFSLVHDRGQLPIDRPGSHPPRLQLAESGPRTSKKPTWKPTWIWTRMRTWLPPR